MSNIENNKKPIYKKWWFWVIIGIIVIIGFSSSNTNQTNTNNNVVNNTNNQIVQGTTKIIFLEGTNSDDFASILESVTEISGTNGVVMGDSITYAKSNEKYSISIDADKDKKEIYYARIICLTKEDPTNVFMAFNRMNYKTENDAELTNWLTENIGKEATTKIGDANFTLSLSTSNNPILEMKTDGSDDYMQEQIDKAMND